MTKYTHETTSLNDLKPGCPQDTVELWVKVPGRGHEVSVQPLFTPVGHGLQYGDWEDFDGLNPERFIRAYRRAPEPVAALPTDPGAYSDRNGRTWALDIDGYWYPAFPSPKFGNWHEPDDVREYAPFTRLVPLLSLADIVEALDAWLYVDNGEVAGIPGASEAVLRWLDGGSR